jgi:hypothetical protein
MAFDREAAKAAGYTDAEIEEYLAQFKPAPAPGAAETRVEQPEAAPDAPRFRKGLPITEFPGGEEEGLEANPLLNPLDFAAEALGARAAVALGGAGLRAALSGARRAVPTTGRAIRELVPTRFRAAGEEVARGIRRPFIRPSQDLSERVAEGPAGSALARIRGGAGAARVERGAARGAEEAGAVASRVPRETGRVVGEIKPRKPFRPKKKAAVKGSAESRVAKKAPKETGEPSRHEVQYYSESRGEFVPIETMHIGQIRNAMNKLGRKLAASKRPSPVTQKQFDALKAEATHRARQAGELTVPSPTATRLREIGQGQASAGRDFRRLGPAGERGPGKSQAMRGASRPELERRAAARPRSAPPAELEADDLSELLEQSLEAEQAMTEQALTPLERLLVRAALRGEAIP